MGRGGGYDEEVPLLLEQHRGGAQTVPRRKRSTLFTVCPFILG